MTGEWEARKRAGRPIREDWEAGRCLSPAVIEALTDGTQVNVVWAGGNGPHCYLIATTAGYVTVKDMLPMFDPQHDALWDERYPDHSPAWVELAAPDEARRAEIRKGVG
jgi:hypothetical protein